VDEQIANYVQIVEQVKRRVALEDNIAESMNGVHAGLLDLPPVGVVGGLFRLGHAEMPAQGLLQWLNGICSKLVVYGLGK